MISALGNAFRIPDTRQRLAVTAFILALYRLGSWLPTPGVNPSTVRDLFNQSGSGTILGYLNLFSGQALQNLSLFALGIMPYITASIIMQLLAVVVPSLEKMQKEGEAGQRRITQYTRYLTVALAARPVGRLRGRVPQRLGPGRFRRAARPERARLHPDRAVADRRLDAADVDGRATSPAAASATASRC